MCLPKAPKPDPQIAKDQEIQRQAELDRLSLAKKQDIVSTRRTLGRGGPRSLITGESGSGFGRNYMA
jgi:hypothetical protein